MKYDTIGILSEEILTKSTPSHSHHSRKTPFQFRNGSLHLHFDANLAERNRKEWEFAKDNPCSRKREDAELKKTHQSIRECLNRQINGIHQRFPIAT